MAAAHEKVLSSHRCCCLLATTTNMMHSYCSAFTHPSIHPYLYIHLSIHPSIHASIHPYIHTLHTSSCRIYKLSTIWCPMWTPPGKVGTVRTAAVCWICQVYREEERGKRVLYCSRDYVHPAILLIPSLHLSICIHHLSAFIHPIIQAGLTWMPSPQYVCLQTSRESSIPDRICPQSLTSARAM